MNEVATYSDACREYACNAGADNPDSAWILTPWDSWEKNPCYSGPPCRHPEDFYEDDVLPVIVPEYKFKDSEPEEEVPF